MNIKKKSLFGKNVNELLYNIALNPEYYFLGDFISDLPGEAMIAAKVIQGKLKTASKHIMDEVEDIRAAVKLHKLSEDIKQELHKEDNKNLRNRSGNVDVNDKLVSFLYSLLRDHLPAGDVEALVRDSQESDVNYTNGYLAQYAEDLAKRLK